MSIHVVTEEITVKSEVEILATPGTNAETITKLARKEVDRVCAKVSLYLPATEVYIGQPVYQKGQRWLVNITVIHRSTTVIDLSE